MSNPSQKLTFYSSSLSCLTASLFIPSLCSQDRGGEGREEDEVGEGPGHWSTLLQRQRAFSLVLLIIFNSYCCGPRSWLWSMMDDVIDH